ncbi:MAG: alpha/beta hydrolase [bacterium]|nr:alpha/beta hydrolase [bacterium]
MRRISVFITILLVLTIIGCSDHTEISGVLDVPDALFQYTAEGTGIPCVAFTGSENLGHKAYSDNLRRHLNLIYADPKDMSAEQIRNLSLESIVDDIEKVRNALGVSKIAVIGHSMFGPLPLEYAYRYPDNTAFTISTGARPYSTSKYTTAVSEYWISNASEERKMIHRKNLEELAKVNMDELSPTDQFIKRYLANIPRFCYDPKFDMSHQWEDSNINMDYLDHFGGTLMQNFDNTQNYRKIKSPVLVISGRSDYWAPYYLWEDVKDIIPDFTFHLFDNAGHNPNLEITEEFDKFVIEWIESRK